MKKTINMRMTSRRARELGAPSRFDLALCPVEIDTEKMTPVAAWIAEHITATYVIDEYRDRIGISAIAGFSMAERDRRAGRSEHYIADFTRMYGDYYASQPMKLDEITFPIYGSRFSRPEDVIEATAEELIRAGAVRLVSRNGDAIDIA